MNNDIQKRFTRLNEEAQEIKMQKVKAEAQLETLTTRQQELEKKILELTNTKTLEAAKEKHLKLQAKIEALVTEAEAILNE